MPIAAPESEVPPPRHHQEHALGVRVHAQQAVEQVFVPAAEKEKKSTRKTEDTLDGTVALSVEEVRPMTT